MVEIKRSVSSFAWSAIAAGMLCLPIDATAGQALSDPPVRATSEATRKLLADGLCRSATMRSLAAQLDRSDVIVLVELSLDPSAGQGRTSLIGASAGARFLQTYVSARLPPDRRLEILGHELQHAVEIAGMPDARNQKGLREGYLKLGWQLSTTHDHETEAARDVERRVRREIAGDRCS